MSARIPKARFVRSSESLPRRRSVVRDRNHAPVDMRRLLLWATDALHLAHGAFEQAGAVRFAKETRILWVRAASLAQGVDSEIFTATPAPASDDPNDAAVTSLSFLTATLQPSRDPDAARRDLLVERARTEMKGVKRAAARVLVRMLDDPEIVISVKELCEVAGVRSGSDSRSIRVYISHLRSALAAHGITDAIKTGRPGYAVRASHAKRILDLLA